jgi:hypothetical protein
MRFMRARAKEATPLNERSNPAYAQFEKERDAGAVLFE